MTDGGLGIIAGAGRLPVDLAERCRDEARPYHVIRLAGIASPELDAHPGTSVALGQLGRALQALKGAGCTRILFIGKVMRPPLHALKLDWAGFTGLMSVLFSGWQHDDRLHRGISRLFEKRGIHVVGPAEVWPDMLVGEEVLTKRQPTDAESSDITLAVVTALEVGATDRGQGAVVRGGAVIATEGRDHTDGLLARVAASGGQGGVLAKFAKPHQDRRVDLPVIGPDTIKAAASARLSGIVIEAGGAILVRRDETVLAADAAGLFIMGLKPDKHHG